MMASSILSRSASAAETVACMSESSVWAVSQATVSGSGAQTQRLEPRASSESLSASRSRDGSLCMALFFICFFLRGSLECASCNAGAMSLSVAAGFESGSPALWFWFADTRKDVIRRRHNSSIVQARATIEEIDSMCRAEDDSFVPGIISCNAVCSNCGNWGRGCRGGGHGGFGREGGQDGKGGTAGVGDGGAEGG